jgi:hypothetical protein
MIKRTMATRLPRRCGRIEADFPATVLSATGLIQAHVFDLSHRGILLLAPGPMEVGSRVVVSIPWRGEWIRLPSVVRWIDAAGSLDACVLGCEFAAGGAAKIRLGHLLWRLASSPDLGPAKLPA